VYQVGKETKYLQMMHGQPSIKISTLVVGQKTRKQKSALRLTQLGSWKITISER